MFKNHPALLAWDEEEGIAIHQVSRFQPMAPIRAEKIRPSLINSGMTMPEPTVLATCSPKNRKAMKLKNAAQATAAKGGSTRVATMVAMELAASCRPFRKSNASATTIRKISSGP